MDAFNDPNVDLIVVMSSAQVGKTEILNNVAGYYVDQDPSPILILQPTLEMGESWSKDRLAPMLRDTPALRGKVKDPRSRDSGNTLLHKTFPGGHITIAGANSPASLASRPVRIVLCDEVDRYPASAAAEGDPVSLGFKRTSNFWNRKKAMFSTPTIRGASRIETAYEQSDKCRFCVPCPLCGEGQFLSWAQVKWNDGDPETARYECLFCRGRWDDGQRYKSISRGHWVATAPFYGVRGHHLSELYSPWSKLSGMVSAFLAAKPHPEQLKTWVNTTLGESWEDRSDVRIDAHALWSRCEIYDSECPAEVAIITAGADVQADRIEVEIVGWGRDEESWSLATFAIPGDTARTEVWSELDAILMRTYDHPSGGTLRVRASCIDSGYKDAMVLRFTRDKFSRRVFAIKGAPGTRQIWPRKPSRKNQIPFYLVGVDPSKDAIFDRLRIAEHGPGYMHFPIGRDLEYFEQLTAERKVTRYVNGVPRREWRKDSAGARNEALDCRVYAYAALHALYAAGVRLNAECQRIATLARAAESEHLSAHPQYSPPAGVRTDDWFGGRGGKGWL